jgi:hypothetical protein
MTQVEWFAATDPQPLLAYLRPNLMPYPRPERAPPPTPLTRKMRLLAVACARMVWDILSTDSRSAVLVSERFADGKSTETDLRAAEVGRTDVVITFAQHARMAARLASTLDIPWQDMGGRSAASAIATRTVGHVPLGRVVPESWHHAWNRAYAEARAVQAAFVRDIFPPPYNAPRFDPTWLTSTVIALAQQMEDSGDFSIVPILADALQDAGCDDEMLLQCCRGAGNVHVRGNWVVDLVCGRG